MLAVDRLTKRFGGLLAVSAVSFAVERAQVMSIVGPNGAGKTTLFNLITGITRPDNGTVSFEGQPVTGLPPHRLAALGIGRTFQNIRLFAHLNALENVMVGRTCRGGSGVLDAVFATPRHRSERRDSIERAEFLLDWVGVGANRFR